MKNHCDGDITEHNFRLQACNYTQIYPHHRFFFVISNPISNWNGHNSLKLLPLLTAKQAVSPGRRTCICPDTAFSLTPDSIHGCPNSLHA